MNNKILQNLIKDAVNIGKRFRGIKYEKPNLVVFSFLFIMMVIVSSFRTGAYCDFKPLQQSKV